MSSNAPKEIVIVEFTDNEAAVNYLIQLGFRRTKNNWFPDWEQEHFKLFRNTVQRSAWTAPRWVDRLLELEEDNEFDSATDLFFLDTELRLNIEARLALGFDNKFRYLLNKIRMGNIPSLIKLHDNKLFMMFSRPDKWIGPMFVPIDKLVRNIKEVVCIDSENSDLSNRQYELRCGWWTPLTYTQRTESIRQCVDAGLTLNKRFLADVGMSPAPSTKPARILIDYSLEFDY
jgi:hypothetical protein